MERERREPGGPVCAKTANGLRQRQPHLTLCARRKRGPAVWATALVCATPPNRDRNGTRVCHYH
jgi:hypothetical protein